MQQKNCVLLPPQSYASLTSLLSSLFSLLERKRELEHERRTTAAVLPQAPPPLRTSSAARGLFLRGAGAGGAGGREKARSSNSFADGRQRRRSADFAPRFPASSGSSFSARSSPLPPADARRVFSHPVEALEELLELGTEQRGEVVFEKEATEAVATTTSSSSPSSPAPLLLLSLSSSLVLLGLCAFWLYLHV